MTIQPRGNDGIRLQWDPPITADNGRILQGAEWVVLYGSTEAAIDQILTTTTDGIFDIDISGLPSIGFYAVQALEMVAGAVNITLLGLNMRDGLRMKGKLRRR